MMFFLYSVISSGTGISMPLDSNHARGSFSPRHIQGLTESCTCQTGEGPPLPHAQTHQTAISFKDLDSVISHERRMKTEDRSQEFVNGLSDVRLPDLNQFAYGACMCRSRQVSCLPESRALWQEFPIANCLLRPSRSWRDKSSLAARTRSRQRSGPSPRPKPRAPQR